MVKFSNLKIQLKLLCLIGMMSIVASGIAYFGCSQMWILAEKLSETDTIDSAATLGARLNQNVIQINRSEYQIAADPTAKTIGEARANNETSRKLFMDRYAEALKTPDATETAQLANIKRLYETYMQKVDSTFAEAERLGSRNDGVRQQINANVAANRDTADALQKAVAGYVDHIDDRGSKIADTAIQQGKDAANLMIVVAAVGVLLGIAIGWLVAQFGVSRPIQKSVEELNELAKGRLDVEVTGIERGDECGDIAKGLLVFRDNARRARELEAQTAEQKAHAEAERRAATLALADDFEKSVGGIVGLVSAAATEMQAAAAQLSATAQEASAQSVAVSAAAEEAGANVASVAASAEELGASVGEIGRQVETSATISHEAVREADGAAAIVTELNEVASSIGGVVDMIAGLAAQTNLLALNATIESARAGEAGKGFAVVASEVKALASQTARATSEISAKIGQIQEATGKASTAMQNIIGTIQNINQTSSAIASAVEQQSAATQEIVQAVNQASVGTTEVTSNITGVADAAEQTGAAAAQVLSSSGELAEQAERLHQEMDKFLANVRAA